MEQIRETVTNLNAQTPMSLQSPPSSTPNIPREQHAALFAIINKSRLLNGWLTRTAQELDATIRTWAEAFSWHSIPVTAYQELYKRAFDVRQQKMQSGGDVPAMDATLLVSQWTGPFGLKAELKQREVEAGRTLSGNAESICEYCHGSGFKIITQSGYMGTIKCDHGNGSE